MGILAIGQNATLASDVPGALTGTSAPQFVIPANTLAVNTSYTCRLLFAHFTQVNTTSYGQGVTGYAGNYSETKFPLITSAPLDVKRFAVIKGAIYRQTGLGVPALVDGKPYDFVSRCFGPNVGIDEDPVTGSAHCLLAPWWTPRLGRTEMRAAQISARGGDLRLRLEGAVVSVAGEAVTVLRAELDV